MRAVRAALAILPSIAPAVEIPIDATFGTEAGCIAAAAERKGSPIAMPDLRAIFYVTPERVVGFGFLCVPIKINFVDPITYVRCKGHNNQMPIVTIVRLRLDQDGQVLIYDDDFRALTLERCESRPVG